MYYIPCSYTINFHAYQPESVLNYVELRTDCLLSNLMTIIVSFLLFSHKKILHGTQKNTKDKCRKNN